MHRIVRSTLLGGLLAAASAPALSQVTLVGPFTGDLSETFPLNPAHMAFQPCLVGRAFNNTADLCTPGGAYVLLSSSWSFRCVISAYSTPRFCGSAGTPLVFTFDNDITSFGGYFGTNSWMPGSTEFVTVRFLDRSGALIDSVIADVADDCTWRWNGWAAPGIASIEIINSAFSGGFVDIDDLEITFGSTVGTSYCPGMPNSTGQPALLTGAGSAAVAMNNLTLEVEQLPQMAFGYFLGSQTMGNTPNPAGSQGTLCLGGSIGRFVGPGMIQNSGTTGTFSLQINLTALPLPVGSTAAAPGDTWFFQCWHRDQNPQVTSNFSNGLEVVFV